MKAADRLLQVFRAILPSPFAIALVLTALTFVLAFFLTRPESAGIEYALDLVVFWEQGLWKSDLLAFAVQMMLILVLGHTLALTKPVARVINHMTGYCTTSAKAAALVALLTIPVGFINWGLGLIFGAILARKVGESAASRNIQLNYPLIGAAGYAGMMVWHGGISGSSLIKVAERGHLKNLVGEDVNQDLITRLPDAVTFADTVFSLQNILVSLALIILIPALLFFLGKMSADTNAVLPAGNPEKADVKEKELLQGAERLDYSRWLSAGFGIFIIAVASYRAFVLDQSGNLGFITPDYLNFCLLGWCLILHKNLHEFLKALGSAIGGASGILIQFPLYFGILGIMNSSGLVHQMAGFFVAISTETTYPVFTFISAGMVNFFVPSGGGQWMVQGPIVIQAADALHVDLPKSIMALAYGDQITNMLQPFWALPLLGITGLKAKDLLPYTALMMLVGSGIFIVALFLW